MLKAANPELCSLMESTKKGNSRSPCHETRGIAVKVLQRWRSGKLYRVFSDGMWHKYQQYLGPFSGPSPMVIATLDHMQQVPRKQIYAKQVLERNRAEGRPLLLKAVAPRRITRMSLPHLMHTQCPVCASEGNGGFCQGAWNTSLSINQE